MSLFERVLQALGVKFTGQDRLDRFLSPSFIEKMLHVLQELAERDDVPVERLEAELLAFLRNEFGSEQHYRHSWDLLTPRERQIVRLYCRGSSNNEIAEHLVISRETVKTHLRNATRKFGFQRRAELRRRLTGWSFIHEDETQARS
jgi:DNA-binding CsgD family transcriptional regulator